MESLVSVTIDFGSMDNDDRLLYSNRSKGNAYALLRIYQVTHDEKYLHRAFALAEYCADFGNGNLKHAEQYLSLFEGKAELSFGGSSFRTNVLNLSNLPQDTPACFTF